MRFRFKAIKPSGEHYDDVMDAPDKISLYKELQQKGDTVISVDEDVAKNKENKKNILSFLNTVSTNDKIILARNMGSMLEAGLPLTRSLSVLERQSKNKKLKEILSQVQEDINKGDSLSQSLSKFPKVFPAFFISMIKAGEESGTISQSLKSIANQMEKIHTLVKRLRGAMIYPSIVIVAMIIISILLLIFLVPTLQQTFEELNLELPLQTRIIIGASSFLQNNIILSMSMVLLLIFSFVGVLKTKSGKRAFSFVILKTPLISGMVKESNSAKTARTLSSLLVAGVDFLVSIQITKEVLQNDYYKDILSEAEEKVSKGGTISSVLMSRQDLYPAFIGEMASIGEETGKISEMLANTADFYEDSVDQKTKNLSTIIEPLLMIFIGLFVGIFAVSMLGPIYSLVGSI